MEKLRKRIDNLLKTKGVALMSLAHGDNNIQSKLSRQVNRGSAITFDTLMLFLDAFPDLNAEWLMRGTGEMFKTPLNLFGGNGKTSQDYIEQKVKDNLLEGLPEMLDEKMKSVTDEVKIPDSLRGFLKEQRMELDSILARYQKTAEQTQTQVAYMGEFMKYLMEENKSQKTKIENMKKDSEANDK